MHKIVPSQKNVTCPYLRDPKLVNQLAANFQLSVNGYLAFEMLRILGPHLPLGSEEVSSYE